MKKIVLTGGGTAGHVTPNLALLPKLKELGYEVTYMGSLDGIEKKLIADFDIPYYGVPVGKLRRYLDPKNLTDPFKVIKGYHEAKKYLKEVKPDVVFSKGGYSGLKATTTVSAAAAAIVPNIIMATNRAIIPSRFFFMGFSLSFLIHRYLWLKTVQVYHRPGTLSTGKCMFIHKLNVFRMYSGNNV